MTLLQRNYPHVKIDQPLDTFIAANSFIALGFATQSDDVASISAKVLVSDQTILPIAQSVPGLVAPFPYDWFAIFTGLPTNLNLKLVVEAVDTYGNIGSDSHGLICLSSETGDGTRLAPPRIIPCCPGLAPTPFPYPSGQQVVAMGMITDSTEVSSMTAVLTDKAGNTYNGTLVGLPPQPPPPLGPPPPYNWTFSFNFAGTAGDPATLVLSSAHATPVTINLRFA